MEKGKFYVLVINGATQQEINDAQQVFGSFIPEGTHCMVIPDFMNFTEVDTTKTYSADFPNSSSAAKFKSFWDKKKAEGVVGDLVTSDAGLANKSEVTEAMKKIQALDAKVVPLENRVSELEAENSKLRVENSDLLFENLELTTKKPRKKKKVIDYSYPKGADNVEQT